MTRPEVLLFALCLILTFWGEISSEPLFYNAPRRLTSFVSSASSPSQPTSNIADLRPGKGAKLQEDLDDDDDFFKQPIEDAYENEETTNEATPGIIQKKIAKIVRKIQFLSMLSNNNNNNNDKDDDDFQKEQDDFDREFEEDFENSTGGAKENLETSGYFYGKPAKVEEAKNAKQEVSKLSFNPSGIGVFFMELIGSLVGLAYGAAAQFNHNSSS